MEPLVIATRRSPLAMWQAEYVRSLLAEHHPELEVRLLPLSTQGDKILDTPLAKIGGKGLFVKELEQAMLDGRADIAVHSMKDVPVEFPAGLELAVICERETPFDALVSHQFDSLDALPQGAVVGTSSLRPDLVIRDLRGNVNTRLRKLDDGEFQAIVLAAAGLKRLEMGDRIRQLIPAEVLLPANGQGAVGIECRQDDDRVKALLAPLNHQPTALRVAAERRMNQHLQGGCQVPIGSYACWQGDNLVLDGMVGTVDGSKILRYRAMLDNVSRPEQAHELGIRVAEALLEQGADRILADLYGRSL